MLQRPQWFRPPRDDERNSQSPTQPAVISQMQFARMVIAGDRAEALLARTKCRCPVPAVIHNALGHNLGAAPKCRGSNGPAARLTLLAVVGPLFYKQFVRGVWA